MPNDFGKDFPNLTLTECLPQYMMISLIASKIRVLIIGGGRAGFIKARTFMGSGMSVTIVSKAFCEEIMELKEGSIYKHEALFVDSNCNGDSSRKDNERTLTLIKDDYKREYIEDKHLVVISTSDKIVNDKIKEHCDKMAKIYLNCEDHNDGLFVTPMQVNTRSISAALHTKGSSPKTARFLADKLKKNLEEYDEFVKYACELRNAYKDSHLKDKIIEAVNTEAFYIAFKNNTHEELLKYILA